MHCGGANEVKSWCADMWQQSEFEASPGTQLCAGVRTPQRKTKGFLSHGRQVRPSLGLEAAGFIQLSISAPSLSPGSGAPCRRKFSRASPREGSPVGVIASPRACGFKLFSIHQGNDRPSELNMIFLLSKTALRKHQS